MASGGDFHKAATFARIPTQEGGFNHKPREPHEKEPGFEFFGYFVVPIVDMVRGGGVEPLPLTL
jgi:hypothetical protein